MILRPALLRVEGRMDSSAMGKRGNWHSGSKESEARRGDLWLRNFRFFDLRHGKSSGSCLCPRLCYVATFKSRTGLRTYFDCGHCTGHSTADKMTVANGANGKPTVHKYKRPQPPTFAVSDPFADAINDADGADPVRCEAILPAKTGPDLSDHA